MSPYIYLLRVQFFLALTYRFEVFSQLLGNSIVLVTAIFLWRTTYQGIPAVKGVTEAQMVTYTILAMLLHTSVFQVQVHNRIRNKVRNGDVAVDLTRPWNILFQWLADDVGAALASGILYIVPLVSVALVFLHPPLPANAVAALLFVPSCILSFAILWLISALVGMIAFWAMDLGNMGVVKDAVVYILAGALVPLWFFPPWFQAVSQFLPFQYIYQTPLSIYIGKIDWRAGLVAMAVQLVWIGLLALLAARVWRAARNRVLVQGG